jgi:uncharacterized protein YqcC (DUF446 family)
MLEAKKFTILLWALIPRIVQIIMEKHHLSNLEAIQLLYNSEVYSRLSEEETKLWHLSALTLYDLLDEELSTGKITYPEEQ